MHTSSARIPDSPVTWSPHPQTASFILHIKFLTSLFTPPSRCPAAPLAPSAPPRLELDKRVWYVFAVRSPREINARTYSSCENRSARISSPNRMTKLANSSAYFWVTFSPEITGTGEMQRNARCYFFPKAA